MAVFDSAEARRLLDATFGVADYVVTVASPTLRLATSAPSDTAAGTQVSGGSYAAQAMAFSAASGRSNQNSGTVSFTGMPVATVTHVDIYDGANTTRKAYGALSASKTTAAGDTLSFAPGSVQVAYS